MICAGANIFTLTDPSTTVFRLIPGNGKMHEVLLFSRYFSTPFEARFLHAAHDGCIPAKCSKTSLNPKASLNKAALGPELHAIVIQAIPGAIDVYGHPIGMV